MNLRRIVLRSIGPIIIVGLAFSLAGVRSNADAPAPQGARVISIGVDGWIELDNHSHFQLAGVLVPRITDASASCGAAEARQALDDALVGQSVTVTDQQDGTAYIERADGTDASELIAAAGWAAPALQPAAMDDVQQARARGIQKALTAASERKAGWWQACSH